MALPHTTLSNFTTQHAKRFYKFVQVGRPDECWPWTQKWMFTKKGYGRFRIYFGNHPTGKRRFQNLLSHRIAYFLHYGVDPLNLQVCHTCDNPPCCNPSHLFLGTNDENMRDMVAKGRQAKGLKNVRYTNPNSTRGERNGNALLTEEQVREIRKRFSGGGVVYADLAVDYKVKPHVIRQVVRRINWRHVL